MPHISFHLAHGLQSRLLEDASIMCNSWSPRNVSIYYYHIFRKKIILSTHCDPQHNPITQSRYGENGSREQKTEVEKKKHAHVIGLFHSSSCVVRVCTHALSVYSICPMQSYAHVRVYTPEQKKKKHAAPESHKNHTRRVARDRKWLVFECVLVYRICTILYMMCVDVYTHARL